MIIATASPADATDWAAMRQALWPSHDIAEHVADIADYLAAPGDTLTLIARDTAGAAIGFAEASIRHDFVNGCDTSPVGFLEGIYVVPEHRRTGIAGKLVDAVADWVRQRGYTQLASDADINNTQSHQMHEALGFEETQRVVYFRKQL
ncbi:aminoglycoside 6'-acetyltransferase [Devosia epidermidihirudinis]|uniref:Aminoglycoside N(6')-acetyltransferase type 1 n=1 Tax=Devosia epidermidihirudinis TaxID=1293439 RepID=A0A0F5Q3R3_9HYPH|nr:aminoglycoside 6'-N-acetyltransferase [Devosia epidermidihirudinis]KKC35271.1 aminoglycoside 6'-acetyltransferase [Devosia epidermidihirudinis]